MQNTFSYSQDLSIYLEWSGFICAFVNLNVSLYCDNTWRPLWRSNPVLDIRYFYVCLSTLFSLVTGLLYNGGYRWVLSSLPFFCSTMLRNVTSHSHPSSSHLQLCSLDSQRALTSTISITPCHIIMTSYASLTLRNSCTTL